MEIECGEPLEGGEGRRYIPRDVVIPEHEGVKGGKIS